MIPRVRVPGPSQANLFEPLPGDARSPEEPLDAALSEPTEGIERLVQGGEDQQGEQAPVPRAREAALDDVFTVQVVQVDEGRNSFGGVEAPDEGNQKRPAEHLVEPRQVSQLDPTARSAITRQSGCEDAVPQRKVTRR